MGAGMWIMCVSVCKRVGIGKGPVPLEPAITRDQFSRATRAGRGQS